MVCLDANIVIYLVEQKLHSLSKQRRSVEEVPRRPCGDSLVSLIPDGAIDAAKFARTAHEQLDLEV